MVKTIRCPKCNHIMTISGNSGEKKEIECSNCGLKGKFTFPKEIESSDVERFGSPKRIRGYKVILYFGIALSIVAVFLYFFRRFLVFPLCNIWIFWYNVCSCWFFGYT